MSGSDTKHFSRLAGTEITIDDVLKNLGAVDFFQGEHSGLSCRHWRILAVLTGAVQARGSERIVEQTKWPQTDITIEPLQPMSGLFLNVRFLAKLKCPSVNESAFTKNGFTLIL